MDVRTFERRDLAPVANWFSSIHDAVAWAGPDARFPVLPEELDNMLATRTADGRACMTFAVNFDPEPELQGTFGIAIDEATKHATLARVALAPRVRGKRLGTAMVRYAARFAFEKASARSIGLSVFAENEPAIAAYRANGFAFDGASRDVCVIAGRAWHLMRMRLLAADVTTDGRR